MTALNTAIVAESVRTLHISRFSGMTDTAAKPATLTWSELIDELSTPRVSSVKDGPLISFARFVPPVRKGENVKAVSALAYDFDHGTTKDEVKARMDSFPFSYLMHSTHSHKRVTENNPRAEDRLRVIVPLACDVPPDRFPAVWNAVGAQIGISPDPAPKALSQMFYTPAIASTGMRYFSHAKRGDLLDWRTIPESRQDLNVVKTAEPVGDAINNGSRNTTLTSLAGSMQHRGMSEVSIIAALREENAVKCVPPLPDIDLRKIVKSIRRYEPKQTPWEEAYKPLQIINAANVQTKKVEFLWEPYLPKGYVTLFSGQEGVGKSWVFCAITAGITTGFLPLGGHFEPQNVLYFAREDAPEDALVPRLINCRADLSRVSIVTEKMVFDEKGLIRVKGYIAETNPAWVVIDPLFSYSDPRLDLNKPHHARAVTTAIEDIAKQYAISISYLIHFNKSMGQGDARAAVSSSQEFSNAARSIVLIGKDPKDEDRRALVHRKHNYSPKGKSIGYEIRHGANGGEFFWHGESTMTERDLVDRAGTSEEIAEKSEAVAFLIDVLKDGEVEAAIVTKQAQALRISDHQLRTGRSKLGIEPYSRGFGVDKKWFWKLKG